MGVLLLNESLDIVSWSGIFLLLLGIEYLYGLPVIKIVRRD
ncbi:hypothetical protein [Metabacillus niabensis]